MFVGDLVVKYVIYVVIRFGNKKYFQECVYVVIEEVYFMGLEFVFILVIGSGGMGLCFFDLVELVLGIICVFFEIVNFLGVVCEL